jgi:hypothetical protein
VGLSILGWIRAVLHGSGVSAILSCYATAVFPVESLDSVKLLALSTPSVIVIQSCGLSFLCRSPTRMPLAAMLDHSLLPELVRCDSLASSPARLKHPSKFSEYSTSNHDTVSSQLILSCRSIPSTAAAITTGADLVPSQTLYRELDNHVHGQVERSKLYLDPASGNSPPLATGWSDVRIDGLHYCVPWFWNECRKLWLCLVRVKASSAVGWFHPLDNVVPVSVLPTDIQYVPRSPLH